MKKKLHRGQGHDEKRCMVASSYVAACEPGRMESFLLGMDHHKGKCKSN